jgi:hypothetical protein
VYEEQTRILWNEDIGPGKSRLAVYVQVLGRWYVADHIERVSDEETRLIEQYIADLQRDPEPSSHRAMRFSQ